MSHAWGLIGLILLCAVLTGITCAELAADQNKLSVSGGTTGSGTENATGIALPVKEKIDNLTNFVKKGVDFAKSNPKEDVLARFNEVNGEFVQGEQYIFAYDMNGTTLAHPIDQEWIGKDRTNKTDINGMATVKAMEHIAEYGGGYLYFIKANPAQNNTEQVKFTYVEPVDDIWFIGSGFYLPDMQGIMDKKAIEELVARVEKAAAFGEKEGKEKASAVFNDRNDTWAKDNTYMFTFDFNGTVLAMPYQPETVGTSRWNYTDKYGSLAARLEIDTAKDGGGFVYVVYYNPESGKDELKLCYVLPVQNDWVVGSGIYSGNDLSSGDITS